MTTSSFIVNDVKELRVMQRVFREAKFCKLADDDEISDSPIVGDLFRRLLDVLISKEVELGGERAQEKWTRWLTMDNPSRDEWVAVKERALRNDKWASWTREEKVGYLHLLLSPFVVSADLINRIVDEERIGK
jgi:hypothetical protein